MGRESACVNAREEKQFLSLFLYLLSTLSEEHLYQLMQKFRFILAYKPTFSILHTFQNTIYQIINFTLHFIKISNFLYFLFLFLFFSLFLHT